MGKLIKNHWARLIILTAAAYQVAAALSGFFWPKIFWDFLSTNLDRSVRPVPILQIINLLLGLLGLCWEWPLPLFTTATFSSSSGSSNNNISNTHRQGHRQTPSTTSPSSSSRRSSTFYKALAAMHGSIEARLVVYPLSSLAALLLYQGTNAGLYYIIGMTVYFWGFSEGEVVMGVPWTLPRRRVGKSLNGV